jgi:hypothetical protein
MRTCVINYARDGRENYEAGQERLLQSLLDVGYYGAVDFRRSLPGGCPPHYEVSHAFKAYMFKEAFEAGFDLVLWLDASVVVQQPLDSVWETIRQTGSFFVANGDHTLDQWASDDQLGAMGCSVLWAPHVAICCSGVVGLNATFPDSQRIIRLMIKLVHKNGGVAYNGTDRATSSNFVEPRHDQNLFSWYAHTFGMKLYPKVACYENESGVEDAIFAFKSMGGLDVQPER